MEERKLYPLAFAPVVNEYQWGSESFLIADLGYVDSIVTGGWLAGNTLSEVMDTYMDRITGDGSYAFTGRQFPVQVKRISVRGRMPLRVHPDKDTASQRYDCLGKEKLWYIVRAGKGARIFAGFASDTDASALYAACTEGGAEKLLHSETPFAGRFYRIMPGVPHAAEGELEIIEISESSPLDFFLHGWGRQPDEEEFDPALDLTEALDFINYGKWKEPEAPHFQKGEPLQKLIDIPEFRVTRLDLDDPLHIYSERFDSFIVYACVSGAGVIKMDIDGVPVNYALREGETILIPAECPEFHLVPDRKGTVILEASFYQEAAQAEPAQEAE